MSCDLNTTRIQGDITHDGCSAYGVHSVIIIKAVAANSLTATARTRLQITADIVERTARHSAIITFRNVQIVLAAAITHPGILLAVDHKMRRILHWALVAMPTWLFIIPRHTNG